MKPVKPRICKVKDMTGKVCGTSFIPRSSLQVVCSPICAIYKTAEDKAKKAAKQATEQRIAHRAAKEQAKTRGDYAREAQVVFNAYRRELTRSQGCISCGTINGQMQGGHYRSVGAYPELRYEELNVWAQCARCNTRLSGNLINYRIELIKRIGMEQVDYLEGNHEPKHYSIEDLKEIKIKYKFNLKELARG
jgi:hypothetical protein